MLVACEAREVGPQNLGKSVPPELRGKKVYLINEGNFGRGNASVSAYFPATGQQEPRVFNRYNGGLPLGDVLQDLIQIEDRFYLSLNASGKVLEVDTSTWQLTAEVTNLATPRYLQSAGQRLFATDLYQAKLYVFSLKPLQLDTVLSLPKPGSRMAARQGKLYVSAQNLLVKIDATTLARDSVYAPGFTFTEVVEASQQIWLLEESAPAQLWQLNPKGELLGPIALATTEGARFLRASGSGEQLFYVQNNKQLCQINTQPPYQAQKITSLPVQNVYGLAVDPQTNQLYLSDALDYNQNADIFRYRSNGELINQFKGGLLTNGFFFNLP